AAAGEPRRRGRAPVPPRARHPGRDGRGQRPAPGAGARPAGAGVRRRRPKARGQGIAEAAGAGSRDAPASGRAAAATAPAGGRIAVAASAGGARARPPVTRRYLLASDFDQTLSFNDSGVVLSELLGRPGFRERVAGLARTNLIQQGGELAYLLRHDPEYRDVRREHLEE